MNPFVNAIIDILSDIKSWGLKILVPLAAVIIIIDVIKYKSGDDIERANCKKRIRNTILMSGGIYGLLWFLSYVMTKMSAAGGGNI